MRRVNIHEAHLTLPGGMESCPVGKRTSMLSTNLSLGIPCVWGAATNQSPAQGDNTSIPVSDEEGVLPPRKAP